MPGCYHHRHSPPKYETLEKPLRRGGGGGDLSAISLSRHTQWQPSAPQRPLHESSAHKPAPTGHRRNAGHEYSSSRCANQTVASVASVRIVVLCACVCPCTPPPHATYSYSITQFGRVGTGSEIRSYTHTHTHPQTGEPTGLLLVRVYTCPSEDVCTSFGTGSLMTSKYSETM